MATTTILDEARPISIRNSREITPSPNRDFISGKEHTFCQIESSGCSRSNSKGDLAAISKYGKVQINL